MQYSNQRQKSRKVYNRHPSVINKISITKTPLLHAKTQQQQQQQILLELSAIDQSLASQNSSPFKYQFHKGYIFSKHPQISNKNNPFNTRLISNVQACLKKQTTIEERGFRLWMQENPQEMRISHKYQSINDRITEKSLTNVGQFDLMKIKLMRRPRDWVKYFPQGIESNMKTKSGLKKQEQKTNSIFKPKRVLTQNSSVKSYILPIIDRLNRNPKTIKIASHVKTQNNSQYHPQRVSNQQLLSMLKKCQRVVSIWVPPASYPQFYGMFSYTLVEHKRSNSLLKSQQAKKKQRGQQDGQSYRCNLQKIFFYRHCLSSRLFQAILDWVSTQSGTYVEALQMRADKQKFYKIYENIGWKMKCFDSSGNLKIYFYRDSNR